MQRKTRFSLHFRVHGKFAISDGRVTKKKWLIITINHLKTKTKQILL